MRSDEKWEFRGERWGTVNWLSEHNRSYSNRAVGPCSTEDRRQEQHNEMNSLLSSYYKSHVKNNLTSPTHSTQGTHCTLLFITCGPHSQSITITMYEELTFYLSQYIKMVTYNAVSCIFSICSDDTKSIRKHITIIHN